MKNYIIKGTVYVLGNDIDTDQILTAEFMKINPATEDGYKELGALAMCGLPDSSEPFVNPETGMAYHQVVVAGSNFGCGSSREHAPVALGASGVKAVLAKSFARIFYRNCISTGEVLPVEVINGIDINGLLETGDEVIINTNENTVRIPKLDRLINTSGLGDMLGIVEAGGLFRYARLTGRLQQAY